MEVKLILGDCLEKMKDIPDGSVDLVLTDPPYGTTACKWDTVIPFEPMWEQLKRVTKKSGAIVLFGSHPFTSALVMSNPKIFKYSWVWDKKKPSNFPLAKIQPMKYHEDIVVFSFGTAPYYPIMVPVEGRKARKGKNDGASVFNRGLERPDYLNKVYTDKYPSSILEVSNADQTKRYHPTQKPVALMEYLIKTYTNELKSISECCEKCKSGYTGSPLPDLCAVCPCHRETVLDFTMGSGTTGVACKNLNRNFIGIELDETYFEIAKNRIYENQGTEDTR